MLLIFSALFPAAAIDESIVFGIDEHSSTCSGNADLSFAIDQAQALDDVFDGWISSSFWDESTEKFDANADMEDFADSTQYAWGDDDADNFGSDYADVAYISTHGAHKCDDGFFWSRVVMGQDNQSHGCRSYTNDNDITLEGDRDMFYGNSPGDAEVFIMDTCRSVQLCVFDNGGYSGMDGTSLRTILGFHGDSFDRADQVTALDDYASTSRTSGVGDHWLDQRVVWNVFTDLDQCPTVVVWGSSSTNRDDFFDNGGLDDRFDTGSHTGSTFFFLNNCDPENGNQL